MWSKLKCPNWSRNYLAERGEVVSLPFEFVACVNLRCHHLKTITLYSTNGMSTGFYCSLLLFQWTFQAGPSTRPSCTLECCKRPENFQIHIPNKCRGQDLRMALSSPLWKGSFPARMPFPPLVTPGWQMWVTLARQMGRSWKRLQCEQAYIICNFDLRRWLARNCEAIATCKDVASTSNRSRRCQIVLS